MQVPESFFYKSPSLEPNRKKESARAEPADDSFRRMMAEERRKIKDTDVDAKKNKDMTGEVEDPVEDEEFSLFAAKKPTRSAKQAPIAPHTPKRPSHHSSIADLAGASREEEVESSEDLVAAAPGVDVESLPDEPEVINRQQFTPNATEQQAQLDDVRQNAGYVFVDKKEKEGPQKTDTHMESRGKPSKNEDTPKVISQGVEQEPVETTANDIVHGKQTIKEQQSHPHENPVAASSKEGHSQFQSTLEKQAAEIKNALGTEDPKQTKGLKDLPKTTQEKPEKSETQEEHPRAKDQGPIDARSVAFIPADALPKEKGEIAVNVEQPVQKAPLATKLQEIVDQIVKEIYTLRDDGSSETTIILQNPPLFNGVKVVIETFKNAPNQINITFANLTGPGKRVLDENLASLKAAIEHNDRGMIVQQLTTTTLNEVPRYVADAQQPQKDRDQQGNQSGSQQNKDDESQDQDEGKRRKSK